MTKLRLPFPSSGLETAPAVVPPPFDDVGRLDDVTIDAVDDVDVDVGDDVVVVVPELVKQVAQHCWTSL